MLTSTVLKLLITVLGGVIAGTIVNALRRSRRAVIAAAVAGTLLTLGLIALVIDRGKSVHVQIEAPKNRAIVAQRELVQGTVSTQRATIYVLIRPLSGDEWWIQNIPAIGDDGRWQVAAHFGTETLGAGESFEILAVAASDSRLIRGLQESSLAPGQRIKTLSNHLARSNIITVQRARLQT